MLNIFKLREKAENKLQTIQHQLMFWHDLPSLATIKRLITEFYEIDDYTIHERKDSSGALDKSSYISFETAVPLPGRFEVVVPYHRMTILLTILPPLNDGTPISKNDVFDNLNRQGIAANIVDESQIDLAIAKSASNLIVFEHPIAEGKIPVQPRHGKIIWGKDDKNNKLNYARDFQLNRLRIYTKGEPVCTNTAGTAGVSGKNVFDDEVKPEPLKMHTLTAGNGIERNENGWLATATGHATCFKDHLNIHPVKHIKGNLNSHNGQIKYNGTLLIDGDVEAGANVYAVNIIVRGICRNAQLTAIENIYVLIGLKGTGGKGKLTANGDIRIGYAESATLACHGAIYADKYLYNCDVACTELKTRNSSSVIAGGRVRIGRRATIHVLGTERNVDFILSIGRIPHLEDREASISRAVGLLKRKLVKLNDYKNNLENKDDDEHIALHQVEKQIKKVVDKLDKLNTEHKEIEKEMIHFPPNLDIINCTHEGSKISMFGELMVCDKLQSPTRYTMETHRQIKVLPLMRV